MNDDKWEDLIKSQLYDDAKWSHQYTRTITDFAEKALKKIDINSIYGAVSSARAWPDPETELPKKVKLLKSFECPSGTVHSIEVFEDHIGAYIFSEYRHGDDWFVDHNGALMVKDKVLTDLLVRFGR
jgi:hypothetical protein